jgi:hypothetical protein
MMPQLVTVKVRRPARRPIRLWIPLLPIVLVFSPLLILSVLVGVVACVIYKISPVRAIGAMWRVLSALPGARFHIEHAHTAVLVTIR